eukprot:scaffold117895_cov29-Tisochrysis_lutea.AAC.5
MSPASKTIGHLRVTPRVNRWRGGCDAGSWCRSKRSRPSMQSEVGHLESAHGVQRRRSANVHAPI